MDEKCKKIWITGAAGFIGSNFLKFLINNINHAGIELEVLASDIKCEAINWDHIKSLETNCNFLQIKEIDQTKMEEISWAICEFKPDFIINFAAKTHVDLSIASPLDFIDTNVRGMCCLVEAIAKSQKKSHLIHISTDEVYGALREDDVPVKESTSYCPGNVYAATKAAADLLLDAYKKTYNLGFIIARTSNNFGPLQSLDKFIPKVITSILNKHPIPIYGSGEQRRQWLFVDDFCKGIWQIIQKNSFDHKVYHFGGNVEISNLDLCKKIQEIIGESDVVIDFVQDRPGHDFRYNLNSGLSKKNLGWDPTSDFDHCLRKTIFWYKEGHMNHPFGG